MMRYMNVMNGCCFVVAMMLAVVILPVQASADGRYALVIGNGDYKVDPLKKAVGDAKAVKNRLEDLGFEVIYRENLAEDKIEATLKEFQHQLGRDSVALFYYTGHAMQVYGANYLISPFKRKIKSLESIPKRSINLNTVVDMMQGSGTGLNVILVDASRRAPTTRNIHRGNHGLAKMLVPASTLISFANAIGAVAGDPKGQSHSRYTTGLLELLTDVNTPVETLLKRFHDRLAIASRGKHKPWLAGRVNTNFVFNPAKKENFPTLKQAQEKHDPKHGDVRVEALINMPFIYIKKGSFMMGSPETELHRYRDEILHQVNIEHGFWMGKYEVTFDQYKLFHETTSNTKPADKHWGEGKRPVIMVNWFEASAFANWLSGQTGKHYRLPTEAEWEYAARAGTTTAFSFGNDENGGADYAWNGPNSNQKTQFVGLKKPNPWGLYDIHGNVWEWTSSMYVQDYNGSEKVDSSLNIGFDERSARGGAWYFLPKGMRSADRRLYHPKQKAPYIGFRLVLEE